MNIAEVVDLIKLGSHSRKPVLIAIEGYGGSGKTTIAEQLAKTLGDSYIVNVDDFISKEKLEDTSADKPGFDRERLKKEVLIPLSKSREVSFRRLIWETNTLSDYKKIPSTNYVIVEGISSYHPDIESYYQYKIWIDTSLNEATTRGRKRDAGNENESKWDVWAANDLAYQQKYHPEQRADFIIKN